ncbi:hypothetical protein OF83DRAFT_1110731 [Amylostereum chailletii]|nr:hypothetical protein OF83DRAFT_1110731 [Amylostereum chailletii]
MANQYNYDVSFRFVNNTRWGATLELLGWHTTRDNGIVLFLGPQDRVHLKQNANENYYYVVRHSEFKIESQFTLVRTDLRFCRSSSYTWPLTSPGAYRNPTYIATDSEGERRPV